MGGTIFSTGWKPSSNSKPSFPDGLSTLNGGSRRRVKKNLRRNRANVQPNRLSQCAVQDPQRRQIVSTGAITGLWGARPYGKPLVRRPQKAPRVVRVRSVRMAGSYRVILRIVVMRDNECRERVLGAIRMTEGVEDVMVSLVRAIAIVRYAAPCKPDRLLETVARTGYSATISRSEPEDAS